MYIYIIYKLTLVLLYMIVMVFSAKVVCNSIEFDCHSAEQNRETPYKTCSCPIEYLKIF